MKFLTIAFAMILSAPVFAATSASEIRAALGDRDVKRKLADAEIQTITKFNGGYSIQTTDCVLNVFITYIGAPMPGGPEAIEIRSDDLTCLPTGISVGSH